MSLNFRKALHKRQLLMGAQFCYAHHMFWIAMVGILTDKTAIARIREGHEWIVLPLFLVLLVTSILLIVDFVVYLSDLYKHTTYSNDIRILKWNGERRNYWLLIGAVWHLCLMSTVTAEQGVGSVIAYGSFFILGSLIGVAIAVRDSCIERQINNLT